jgi:hypothetical protein
MVYSSAMPTNEELLAFLADECQQLDERVQAQHPDAAIMGVVVLLPSETDEESLAHCVFPDNVAWQAIVMVLLGAAETVRKTHEGES